MRRMNPRKYVEQGWVQDLVARTTAKGSDKEIAKCGHYAYRQYWNAPDDYGCAGCDNDMPMDGVPDIGETAFNEIAREYYPAKPSEQSE